MIGQLAAVLALLVLVWFAVSASRAKRSVPVFTALLLVGALYWGHLMATYTSTRGLPEQCPYDTPELRHAYIQGGFAARARSAKWLQFSLVAGICIGILVVARRDARSRHGGGE